MSINSEHKYHAPAPVLLRKLSLNFSLDILLFSYSRISSFSIRALSGGLFLIYSFIGSRLKVPPKLSSKKSVFSLGSAGEIIKNSRALQPFESLAQSKTSSYVKLNFSFIKTALPFK